MEVHDGEYAQSMVWLCVVINVRLGGERLASRVEPQDPSVGFRESARSDEVFVGFVSSCTDRVALLWRVFLSRSALQLNVTHAHPVSSSSVYSSHIAHFSR